MAIRLVRFIGIFWSAFEFIFKCIEQAIKQVYCLAGQLIKNGIFPVHLLPSLLYHLMALMAFLILVSSNFLSIEIEYGYSVTMLRKASSVVDFDGKCLQFKGIYDRIIKIEHEKSKYNQLSSKNDARRSFHRYLFIFPGPIDRGAADLDGVTSNLF